MGTRLSSVQTGLTVLAAALPDDPESQTVLGWICAHLTEVELVPGQAPGSPGAESPGAPARVAVICDDTHLAEHTERASTPVVFVSSTGVPPAKGWPAARIRSLHRPGWLPGARHPGVHQAGTVAPPRAVRAGSGRGALIRLAVPEAGGTADSSRLLRTAADALAEAADFPVFAVHLCGPGSAQATEEVTALVPGATVYQDQDPAAERALSDASLLVSSPALTSVTLAQTARIPLALLPPLGAHQQQAAAVLDSAGAPLTMLSGDRARRTDEAEALRRALDAPDELAHWADTGQQAVGDDRRGAQRIARKVRQLLLAPM
ncbi:CGA synthase-related protein [Streptomyces sp. NPDC002888]|uniref:CGA synthase-related protein n=1 Tax=Streptomyces sp. NPDC002888 TaxID=3364668 RepID=UPI00367F0701